METVILNMMTHKSQYRMEDKFYSDVQLLRWRLITFKCSSNK